MKVVLAGFGMESLTKTAADLEALGAETLIVQTDVSQVEQVENLTAATVEARQRDQRREGAADVGVEAAGFGMADTAAGRSVTAQTIFNAGSISKTVTAWVAAAIKIIGSPCSGYDSTLPRLHQKHESASAACPCGGG